VVTSVTFLILPYYNHEEGLRYAIKDDGTAATLEEFFELYEQYKQTPEQIQKLQITETTDNPIKDGPPCLQHLVTERISEGGRNNGLFNIGVYLRKAFP
jgi:O-acetyl-ADP-ribose deacetylase (regulator of RNase III)